MRKENFASNYDIFTGNKKQTSSTLDEIHTGSLWEMARLKYCGDDPDAFPLALICFYDETNTDVFWFTVMHTLYLYTIILKPRL